jgi:hypothetical protein
MADTRLELAQWIAEKGLSVFIIKPNSKRPLYGYSWHTRNTTDPQTVAEWFAATENCNYGVHAGDYHAVIDLDIKPTANGVTEFEKICAENGIHDFINELNTFTVRTPSGGYHLYLKTPFKVRNANDFPNGIDVRGGGGVGYTVGPGSEYSGGKWEVIRDVDIADCPDFLLEYLREPGDKDPNADIPLVEWDLPESIAQAMEFLATRKPAVENENGDDWTFETCCFLRDFGISETKAFELLNTSGWNARCDPSWGDDELTKKIENSYEYGENRPGCKSRVYKIERLEDLRPDFGYDRLTDAQIEELFRPKTPLEKILAGEKAFDDDEVPNMDDVPYEEGDDFPYEDEIPCDEDDEEEEDEEQYWWGFGAFTGRPDTREYLISDWLVAHGMTGIIAKRGTGKSTIALDVACHIATDRDWWETPTLKGWCSIYICGEDVESMILNGRSWSQHHGVAPADDRFMFGDGIIHLDNEKELGRRAEQMKEWLGDRRGIIFLDTWTRATTGLNESDQTDMKLAVKNAEYLAKIVGGPIVICFHPPKNAKELTVRGSAVVEDDSSGLWNLEETAKGELFVRLTNQRIKGGGRGGYREFEITPVDLGLLDKHGKPITGIIPIKYAGTGEEKKPEDIEKERTERLTWAKAVRGCFDYPLHNPVDAPDNHGRGKVADFISTMWQNRERDDHAKAFSAQYLFDLHNLGVKFSMGSNSSTYQKLSKFVADQNGMPVKFEDGWTLYMPPKEGKKKVFRLVSPKKKEA